MSVPSAQLTLLLLFVRHTETCLPAVAGGGMHSHPRPLFCLCTQWGWHSLILRMQALRIRASAKLMLQALKVSMP